MMLGLGRIPRVTGNLFSAQLSDLGRAIHPHGIPVVHVPIFVRIHLKSDLLERQLLDVVGIPVVNGNVHREPRAPLPQHPRLKVRMHLLHADSSSGIKISPPYASATYAGCTCTTSRTRPERSRRDRNNQASS